MNICNLHYSFLRKIYIKKELLNEILYFYPIEMQSFGENNGILKSCCILEHSSLKIGRIASRLEEICEYKVALDLIFCFGGIYLFY